MIRTQQAGAPYDRDHPLVGRVLTAKHGAKGTIRGVLWPWLDVEWGEGDWTFSDGRLFPDLAATNQKRSSEEAR